MSWRVVLAAISVVAAGCQGGGGVHEDGAGPLSSGGGSTGVAGPVEPGQPRVYGGMPLCVTHDDEVMLRRIEPDEVWGELRVDRFGVRQTRYTGPDEEPELLGSGYGTLDPAEHVDPAGFVVDISCDGSELVELAAQMTLTNPAGAAIQGFLVTYESDGREHQLVIDHTVVLCGTERPPGDLADTCEDA